MKEKTAAPGVAPSTEPVGIVISRGRGVEAPPVFSAYVYAPVPEDVTPSVVLATA